MPRCPALSRVGLFRQNILIISMKSQPPSNRKVAAIVLAIVIDHLIYPIYPVTARPDTNFRNEFIRPARSIDLTFVLAVRADIYVQ